MVHKAWPVQERPAMSKSPSFPNPRWVSRRTALHAVGILGRYQGKVSGKG